MKDMPFHRILNLKRLAAVVAGLFFIENVCLVHLAQASLWEERRQALKARDQAEDVYTKATPTAATLLAALPKVEPGMVLPLSQKAISDLHINKDIAPDQKVAQAARLIPDWLQMAIAPYATIQAVDLSKDPKAKTVLLIQDAHLHQEAQTNIAGAIESLGRAVESQNGPLLVGLEGAEKEEIDLAAYFAYPHRKALRETAFALMKANVLKGSEVAAIGYKGQEVLEGPVPSPFVYTAVEKQAEYDANVKAFLASVPIKERAQAALKALGRSLVELRNKYYTPELIRFDEKLAGFEKGDLGISDYVVYLDNLQPAASPNLRELVTAALIEKSMDFHRVEEQRTRMLSALVRNIKESDIQKLLQVSTLFRAGHVSYARYYDYLTGLCRNNGVSLAQYPDMNLYVQYVLKSEKIDQNQLFAELREHEEKVQGRLMTTKEQSAIASLIRDNHLLNKLSQHILTEDEWKVYENRREEIGKIRDRLAQLGQPYPPALAKMDESWRTFEDFYRWALARNKTMSAHLASRLESMPIRYAVMVSGGFHTQGLVQHFKEKDLNVLTISPKITKVEDGPSSLDILASGQKPLDQLFVGERLFLDLPPILAADPEQARDLILAGAAARSGAANQPQTRGEFSAKRTPDGDVVVQRSLPKRLASKVASLLKGPARYVGGILMAFALIFGGSRSAEAVSPQAVPAPVAAVAHLPLAQVPPTQQIAQPPTEVERKDAGASPEAPAPLKFELNEWYSGGKQYEKEGRNWYGRWANVSADQSDEILGNKFLRLTIKPSNPNDLRELFGFAIEVKGLTEEGRIKGGVFLLSATRNDSRSQWQVSSEFGPGAEVTVDPDNGTVSVTIPVAGVRSALQKEGVVRIGQVHVQTGQQNGPKLNFKTIECRVLANAASRPQDVDETFPQISVMRSGWFRTLLYGPIAVVIAALLFFLGRHLRGRSRASRGQPLLSLLLPLAAVVLFGGAASPTVGWEGMSGIDRMFAFFGFLVIILIPMFITVVSGFYLANEWLSRDRMFKSDYDAKRWHRRAAAFLFIWFLGITVYLFSLILHWANMERKSAAPANPSDKVSTTERDKSSKPSSSTLEPPSKTGLLKIKENGGKKLLSFFLPLAAVVLFGGAAAPGQTGNRGILGVLAVTSLLAMTYARKSGRQGIGAGDFSTLSPEDKLEMLTRLQAEGAVVNMTWNNYGRPGEKASQIRSITGQESGPELVVVWLEGYEFGILVKNIQSLVVQQASALGEGTRRDAGELAGQVHSEEESGEGIEDQVVLVSRVDFGFIYDQLGRVGPLFVGMENSDPTFAGCLSQFNSIFSKFRRILGEGSWQWERVPKELLRNVRQLMVQTRSLGVTGSAAAVVSESTKNVIDCINRILGKEQDRESKGRTGGGKALLSLLLSLAAVVLFGGAAAPERTSGALGVLSGLAAQFILLGSLLFLPKKSRSSGPVTLGFGPIIPTILESIVGGGMTWVAMAIFTFAGMDPVTALVVTAVAAALSYAVVQGAVTVGPKGQRVEMGFSRFFQIFVARFMTMLPTFAGMAAIFFVGAPWYWALVGIGLTIVVTTGYNALVMEDRWWGKVKGEVSSCSFSSDGKTLAMVMKDGATRLYDVDRDDKGQITSLTPVALTRMLETLDEYRAREGTGGLAPVEEVKISGEVRSLALSPDGRRLAMAGEDGVVRIFVRDESGRFSAVEEMMFSGEAERLLSLSSDGRTLTVEGKDGRVHIYNIEGGTGGLAPVEEKKGVGDVTLWQNVKALIRRLPGSRRFLVSVLTPFITTLVLLGSQTLSLAQDNVNLEYAPLLSQGGLGSITVFLPFPIMLALFIAYFYLLRICLKSLDKKNVRDPQVGRAGAIHLGMACLALLAWVFSMAFNIEFNFSTYFVLFTLLILAVFEGGVFIFGFFSRQNPYFIAEEDHLSGYELEPFKNWVIENRDKRVFDRGGIHLQMPLSLELIKSYIHIYGLDNPLPSDVRKVMTRHNLNKWEQEVVELLYQWWEKTYLGRKKIVVGDDQAGIQIELIVDKRAVPAIEALTSETPPDTETLTGWLRQWLSGQRPTLLGQPLSLFKTEDRLHHWFDVVEQFNGLGLTPQERESVVAELLDAIADFPRLSMSSLSTVTSNAPFRFLDDQSAVDFALYIFTRLLVAWYRESNANRGGSASEHIIRDALYLDLVDKIFVLLIKGLDEIPGIDSSKVIEEFLFSLAEENPRLKGDIAALLERFPQLKSNAQSLSELADEISADEDSDGLENQGPDDDALGREPVEILVGWDRDSYEIEYERTPPSLNWQFIVWLYHIVSSSLTTVTHRLFHWSKRPKTTALSLFLPLAAVVLFGGASGFSWPALISLVGFFVTIALVAKNRRSIGNFFASLVPKALRKGSAPEFAVQSDVEKSTMRRLLLFTAISAGFLVLVAPAPVAFAGVVALIGGYLGIRYPSGSVRMLSFITRKNPKAEPKMGQQAPSTSPEKPGSAPAASQPASERPAKVAFTRFGFYLDLLRDYLKAPAGHLTRVFRHSGRGGPYSRMALLLAVAARAAEPDGIEFLNQFLDEVFRGYDPKKGEFKRSNLVIEILSGDLTDFETVCSKADEAFGMSEPSQQVPRDNFRRFAIMLLIMRNRSDVGRMQKLPDIKQIQLKDMPPRQFDLWFVLNNVLFNLEPSPADSRQKTVSKTRNYLSLQEILDYPGQKAQKAGPAKVAPKEPKESRAMSVIRTSNFFNLYRTLLDKGRAALEGAKGRTREALLAAAAIWAEDSSKGEDLFMGMEQSSQKGKAEDSFDRMRNAIRQKMAAFKEKSANAIVIEAVQELASATNLNFDEKRIIVAALVLMLRGSRRLSLNAVEALLSAQGTAGESVRLLKASVDGITLAMPSPIDRGQWMVFNTRQIVQVSQILAAAKWGKISADADKDFSYKKESMDQEEVEKLVIPEVERLGGEMAAGWLESGVDLGSGDDQERVREYTAALLARRLESLSKQIHSKIQVSMKAGEAGVKEEDVLRALLTGTQDGKGDLYLLNWLGLQMGSDDHPVIQHLKRAAGIPVVDQANVLDVGVNPSGQEDTSLTANAATAKIPKQALPKEEVGQPESPPALGPMEPLIVAPFAASPVAALGWVRGAILVVVALAAWALSSYIPISIIDLRGLVRLIGWAILAEEVGHAVAALLSGNALTVGPGEAGFGIKTKRTIFVLAAGQISFLGVGIAVAPLVSGLLTAQVLILVAAALSVLMSAEFKTWWGALRTPPQPGQSRWNHIFVEDLDAAKPVRSAQPAGLAPNPFPPQTQAALKRMLLVQQIEAMIGPILKLNQRLKRYKQVTLNFSGTEIPLDGLNKTPASDLAARFEGASPEARKQLADLAKAIQSSDFKGLDASNEVLAELVGTEQMREASLGLFDISGQNIEALAMAAERAPEARLFVLATPAEFEEALQRLSAESKRIILRRAKGRLTFVRDVQYKSTNSDVTGGVADLIDQARGLGLTFTRVSIFTNRSLTVDQRRLQMGSRQPLIIQLIQLTPIEILNVDNKLIGHLVILRNA